MPSPFPGMDPYLENPTWWPSVHSGLIHEIWRQLNATLPKRFVANMGERLYVVQSEAQSATRNIYPDVAVIEPAIVEDTSSHAELAVQTLTEVAGDPAWEFVVTDDDVREPFVEIVPVEDQARVVTVIEILSPSNKIKGSAGRKLYLDKQREVLYSESHLLEIDLLRDGEHTVAISRDLLKSRGTWTYLVCLAPAPNHIQRIVWPRSLKERLPRIRVPLEQNEPDIILNLQPLFDRVYDDGAFARRVDYAREPAVALKSADDQWAKQFLREKGVLN